MPFLQVFPSQEVRLHTLSDRRRAGARLRRRSSGPRMSFERRRGHASQTLAMSSLDPLLTFRCSLGEHRISHPCPCLRRLRCLAARFRHLQRASVAKTLTRHLRSEGSMARDPLRPSVTSHHPNHCRVSRSFNARSRRSCSLMATRGAYTSCTQSKSTEGDGRRRVAGWSRQLLMEHSSRLKRIKSTQRHRRE